MLNLKITLSKIKFLGFFLKKILSRVSENNNKIWPSILMVIADLL